MRPDSPFRVVTREVDVCIVGGGLAGVAAGLAAARRGATVAIVQDRPVLGGNASSEVQVHIGGADRHNGIPHMRETGILEELRLANCYANPTGSWSVWDLVVYDTVRRQENLEAFLNCSVLDAQMDGARIVSVTGWQTTTQTWVTVRAKLFVDASGDSILAPLTGAEFRYGRESREEFGESFAPPEADDKTMGMTCYFAAREYDAPKPFRPPEWIEHFARCDELPFGKGKEGHPSLTRGYWWIELGGIDDSIHDTETIRDDLLPLTLGVFDHIKNSGRHPASANLGLEWVQFLPGKRESRRLVGDHILTQGDLEAGGRFEDMVAYGGWTMDDHHWAGTRCVKHGEPATIWHECPSPYGIPYRCLYSKNVENLFMAGRNISATHIANSSTRVMGTCAAIGQAVGTAAALAAARGIDPRGVARYIDVVQEHLLEDDCYLPWTPRTYPAPTTAAGLAASSGDPEPVRDGIVRQVGADPHCWTASPGEWIAYRFEEPTEVGAAELVLDSGMDELITLTWMHGRTPMMRMPAASVKRFRLEARTGSGDWEPVAVVEENHARHLRVPVGRTLTELRFVLDETWGAEASRVYGFSLR